MYSQKKRESSKKLNDIKVKQHATYSKNKYLKSKTTIV